MYLFEELKGKTFTKVVDLDGSKVIFTVSDDEEYMLYHEQDCCESVGIEDTNGELEWLVDSEILMAEEMTKEPDPIQEGDEDDRWNESQTWTFYRISTFKGTVVFRWLGESNGYYSESVDFCKVGEDRWS